MKWTGLQIVKRHNLTGDMTSAQSQKVLLSKKYCLGNLSAKQNLVENRPEAIYINVGNLAGNIFLAEQICALTATVRNYALK